MDGNFNPNDFEPDNTTPQEDIEPVAWSKKKTGAVFIALLVLILVILLFVRSCSISKRINKSSTTESAKVTTEALILEDVSNGNEVSVENSDNSVVDLTTESVSADEIATEVSTEVVTTESGSTEQVSTEVAKEDNSLVEVQEPVLGEPITSSGVVSGKSIYYVKDSYLYEVRLILVMGNDQNIFCSYYCPRKTWDALATGDSLKVTYQMDSLGGISITTISNN